MLKELEFRNTIYIHKKLKYLKDACHYSLSVTKLVF